MNPKSKKLVSLLLVFSLLMLSANLYAKEKRGAKLLITKKDGWQREGELITVKPNSLLLLDTDGKDVSIDIANIKVIRVVKKSKVLQGLGVGLLIGAGTGAVWGAQVGENDLFSAEETVLVDAIFFGVIGLLIGGIAGAVVGTDKTIQIEGMTNSEIQETLDYLRKKARIRDYR